MTVGWEIKTLGELCVKITDGSHNPPKGVVESEYLMLSSQNVLNGYLDKSIVRHLSKHDFLLEDRRTCAREGDVLLTIVGTIGRTCVLSREDKNITFQRSVCIIKPKPELNPYFLSYQLQFKNKEINEQANGAAQRGFYLKQVERLPIFITSVPEQQRIVNVLDNEFTKIDALKANAEKSFQAAKELFQAALTKELKPKDGWNNSSLVDVVRVINGRAYSKEELLAAGKYKVLRVGNFFTNDNWYYSDLELEDDKYCDKGDLLYAWSASFGPKIWDGDKVIYHYHIWKMEPSDCLNKHFLFYWLQSHYLSSQVMSKLHGTTMVHITKGIMEASHIQYPSYVEQKTIAALLDCLNAKCKVLQDTYIKTIALCDDLKQALLRKAFNCEL